MRKQIEADLTEVQSGLLAQLVEQLTFNQLVEGSNPSQPTTLTLHCNRIYGLLAQLVEQLTFNQLVEGSNPSQPTTSIATLVGR